VKWDETEQKCTVKESARVQQGEMPASRNSTTAEVCEALCSVDQTLLSREQSINVFHVATPHLRKRKQADAEFTTNKKCVKPGNEITALHTLDGKQGRKGRNRRLYGCSEHLMVQKRSFEWIALRGHAECSVRCPVVVPPLALRGKCANDLSGGLSLGSQSGAGQEHLDLLVLIRECDDASTNGAVIRQEVARGLIFVIVR